MTSPRPYNLLLENAFSFCALGGVLTATRSWNPAAPRSNIDAPRDRLSRSRYVVKLHVVSVVKKEKTKKEKRKTVKRKTWCARYFAASCEWSAGIFADGRARRCGRAPTPSASLKNSPRTGSRPKFATSAEGYGDFRRKRADHYPGSSRSLCSSMMPMSGHV